MPTSDSVPIGTLQDLIVTDAFQDYCRQRSIAIRWGTQRLLPTSIHRAWTVALGRLPADRRAKILGELTAVGSLSTAEGNAHLLEAGTDADQPPADIPSGAPVALWFLLHRPTMFRDVYLHHGADEPVWRVARVVRKSATADLTKKAASLAESLRREYCRGRADEHCEVEAMRLADAFHFRARFRGRPHVVETFNERGSLSVTRFCPAVSVHFTYDPLDGSVFLRAPMRAADRETALLRCFGKAVLGTGVKDEPIFALDRLQFPFRPLLDGGDVTAVRVKALHFRYPAHLARRVVKLETPPSDGPDAIASLLRSHVGSEAAQDELQVCHAELQVGLRVEGRTRQVLVRLWPDRCSFPEGPIGIRLRRCLRSWGLVHG